MAGQRNLPALGFLVMAFFIVGLVGVFASFAAPLPLQRALAREAALDAAGAAAQAPDLAAALARRAPQLGDSAKALAGADATNLPARIQAERVAMRARFQAETDAIVFRLRLVIALITLSAAGFGVMLTGAISRR